MSDDPSNAIVAAATTANTSGGYTLAELYTLVSTAGVADSLDVLTILPVLLPCQDLAARDLIAIMGECSSAKEVVMAAQEQVEQIAERAEDDDGDEKERGWVERLVELVELYRAAIPRLKLRKRTASETLQPLLSDLRRALEAVSVHATAPDAKVLVNTVGDIPRAVFKWVQDLPEVDQEEKEKCQSMLKTILDHPLVLFRHLLGYGTAQKAFEACFPRLRMSGQDQSSEEGQQIIETYTTIYKDLEYTPDRFISSPSIISVIVLVHGWFLSSSSLQASLLSPFTPTILVMLQPTSSLQDDALAFLLLILHQNKTSSKSETSPDVIDALVPQLIVLASAHPSPQTRHQAFRILSLLLESGPSQLRLQLLADLIAKCEYPQMRVAAVGLVKDAVLEALQAKSGQSAFGSPMFTRVFGPLLFRPSPPDLFDHGKELDLENFLESPEPKRITEVLSLYYVILWRDTENLTGIRDKDMLNAVEKNLLNPLRAWLGNVMDGGGVQDAHDHALMPLVSLRMGLNRIEEARATL
ncbi:hypothetical protein P691DRAFT_758101 [Macrolepiota fuliginosa MF-IS2]|uniref:Uncharacterized protein n=1 Tax=Macrolepiota fuliginosa MF-IS2 TaxID=1400762 RepID=A0A9P5XHP0_9AGAR|nr:hypothetical protein P691DRAFT_758101 [Macrolepiota fuliginosa MF-IS2]